MMTPSCKSILLAMISSVLAAPGLSHSVLNKDDTRLYPSKQQIPGDIDFVHKDLKPCPPDQILLVHNGPRTEENNLRIAEEGEGAAKYQATLFAAGLRYCEYKLSGSNGDDTVLTRRGEDMFDSVEDSNLLHTSQLLRYGSKDDHFKWALPLVPQRYTDLEHSQSWTEMVGSGEVWLHNPTSQQIRRCRARMFPIYDLVVKVYREVANRMDARIPKYAYLGAILFSEDLQLITIKYRDREGPTAPWTVEELAKHSQFPIYDNEKFRGVCFSEKRDGIGHQVGG
ncbi:hypothetical protein FRC03_012178 [Tulasnella sp. 419]|nr:hypothetical protein FRC03_012178 [Tulasnella sp. 419]